MISQKNLFYFILLCDNILIIWPALTSSLGVQYSKNDFKFKEAMLFRQKCSVCDYSSYLCEGYCSPSKFFSSEKLNIHRLLQRPDGIEAFNCKYSTHKYLNPVHPLICFQYHNSPYLGNFFSQPPEVATLDDFKDILGVKHKRSLLFKFESPSELISPHRHEKIVKIAADDPAENIPLTVPGEIDGLGHCGSNVPIKHLINKRSKCFHLINRQTCLNNNVLNLGGFMVKTKQNHLKFPSILSGSTKTVVTPNVKVLCLDSAVNYFTFTNKVFKTDRKGIKRNVDIVKCKENNLNSVLNDQDICENVVVSTEYVFYMNGSEIHHLDQVYYLANVPVFIEPSLSVNHINNSIIKTENPEDKPKMFVSQEIFLKFIHSVKTGGKKLASTGYKMNDKILINYSKDFLSSENCHSKEECVNKPPKYLSLWSGK